ncbi:Gfo/Idh/MocA family protein [Saccharibacillus alkalitolerans]|uniref:Gfo/Idh/MocA family oxidoreductase n=1 Tax=Saccharibacillus alkalitolerans TaxID=2705290 RepID=A0ABX0F7T0_9BACL|nr:Gfo/Idh/MocA family oxidoreductase [Saccharibacillus alkalitolerans]NGZ77016.1 Gfo/Idh/MocA family oxidoreductase [Saccharibacillus alkalitolerans]
MNEPNSMPKWAIFGPGQIADDFASAIRSVCGSIEAVGARNPDKAEAFARKHDISKSYGSLDELLDDEQVDAVYIATPHNTHHEFVMRCLEKGKHVLCEKAITVNGTQLGQAAQAASERGLLLAEAMTVYHMPLYRELLDRIAEGELGAIKSIHVAFGDVKEYEAQNRFFNPDLAGGVLLDMGTYALSLVKMFMPGGPDRLLTDVRKADTGVDEEAVIMLHGGLGETASVSLSFLADTGHLATIVCEKGTILLKDFTRATRAFVSYADGTSETIESGKRGEALNYEVADFSEWVRLGKTPPTLGWSTGVMAMMDEARRHWGLRYPFE